jgi:hypothetical protein
MNLYYCYSVSNIDQIKCTSVNIDALFLVARQPLEVRHRGVSASARLDVVDQVVFARDIASLRRGQVLGVKRWRIGDGVLVLLRQGLVDFVDIERGGGLFDLSRLLGVEDSDGAFHDDGGVCSISGVRVRCGKKMSLR